MLDSIIRFSLRFRLLTIVLSIGLLVYGSIVIWQGDDRIYGVGGAAPAREVQRIADGLR